MGLHTCTHIHMHAQACQNSHHANTYTCFNKHGKNAQVQTQKIHEQTNWKPCVFLIDVKSI